MLHTVALSLAYLGSAIGVAMVLPQIRRILRHPSMGGVSPWTWAITATACVLWLTYGVRAGILPQIPGNVLLVSGAVAVVLLVPAPWSRTRRALVLAAVTTSLVAFSALLQPEQVGFLAFGIGVTGMWPQVFETVWTQRGRGPSALSLTSSTLKVVSQACWLSYALLAHDVPVVVAATITLSTNALVTMVELSRRRAWARLDLPTPLAAVPSELAPA